MSDFSPTVVAQGNVGSFVDVLREQDGNAVNLTGCTVQFVFQSRDNLAISFSGAATVTDAPNGKVKYTVAPGQTDSAGKYQAQWLVTFVDTTRQVYPFSGTNEFEIEVGLPITRPANVTLIADVYETVRAVLGDFGDGAGNFRFSDLAIDGVVRTVVNLGGLASASVSYGVTGDRKGITPAITAALDLAVLVYKSAKTFLMPESAEYRFRTRALSESFGSQKHFVFDLENRIAEAEFGDGLLTFQNFYGWVNATTGLNIWTVMTDMEVKAPVATVMISRAGVTVNRS